MNDLSLATTLRTEMIEQEWLPSYVCSVRCNTKIDMINTRVSVTELELHLAFDKTKKFKVQINYLTGVKRNGISSSNCIFATHFSTKSSNLNVVNLQIKVTEYNHKMVSTLSDERFRSSFRNLFRKSFISDALDYFFLLFSTCANLTTWLISRIF